MIDTNTSTYATNTIFTLPERPGELLLCILSFLLVVFGIILVHHVWSRKTRQKCTLNRRILFWQFGVVITMIGAFLFNFYCVILPLMFLLAALIMWYLTRRLG